MLLMVWPFFLAFAGPLIYFLVVEIRDLLRIEPRSITPPPLSSLDSTIDLTYIRGLGLWSAWYAVVVVGCRKCLEAGELTYREKGEGEQANDVMHGLVCAAVLYITTGVRAKFTEKTKLFMCLTLLGVGGYAWIFEASRTLHVTLTSQLSDTFQGVVLALCTFLTVGLVLFHSYLTAKALGYLPAFGYVTCYILAAHVFCYFVPGEALSRVHIHHQWWGFVMSLVPPASHQSRAAMWCQAMLFGVHAHGLAAFGAQPIFNNV
eukprot:TRINITY_DN15657_c0_g1_i1.p1 TRINITY_DN15657_c0_g1~~TRINITY_DN15657_c0_g1_i1.p1  ORF type:complete len:275 (+),score=35.76 TRINITY_DN15657_c0_g1_i1:40-825(+)